MYYFCSDCCASIVFYENRDRVMERCEKCHARYMALMVRDEKDFLIRQIAILNIDTKSIPPSINPAVHSGRKLLKVYIPEQATPEFVQMFSQHISEITHSIVDVSWTIVQECFNLYTKTFKQNKAQSLMCYSHSMIAPGTLCSCSWAPRIYVEQLCNDCKQRNPSLFSSASFPHQPDCCCRPISIISKGYYASDLGSVGPTFGQQCISNPMSPPIQSSSTTPLRSLRFLDETEKWTLAKNDSWLLGVIKAMHAVYFEINNRGGVHCETIRGSLPKKNTPSFFDNPLLWIWDRKNHRLRIAAREMYLLLHCGYDVYTLTVPPGAEHDIFHFGFILRDQEMARNSTFKMFCECHFVKNEDPVSLLRILQTANWFSQEALARALQEYQEDMIKHSRFKLFHRRSHST